MYLTEHQVNALYEVVAHINHQGNDLGLVDVVCREFAQVHAVCEEFVGELAQVVDLSHSGYRISPEVRVYEYRLGIGVADNANTLVAVEIIELVFEFRAEVVSLYTVNLTIKAPFTVESNHTGTFCAEV